VATLVLSTVGTVLGGPVGAAIGALIGQSIDQELLGGSSRGPRLGDLSVQTSSYGTQVPRVYGIMRVAGSVVWATDLAEGSATSGAKGQPDTVYSYSVSFAVALSSRPASATGRVWADGKLLRDEDGEFKVGTGFRFHDGSEDQAIDPLIGSVEGVESTPAYRGLALAVFENLELAEFGNRIPFLTFELIADPSPPTLAAILGDATRGIIECDDATPIDGYAAYGRSMKPAIAPLAECFALELFDDGDRLRSASRDTALPVDESELGCSAQGEQAPKVQRDQLPARELPAALRLSYYDRSRDFQAGEARASAGEQDGNEEQHDLPAVLDAAAAKSLCQQVIARRWASRDKVSVRLPTRFFPLEPGSRLELPLSPADWTVVQSTFDSYVVVAELRPSWDPTPALAGDAGRVAPNVQASVADVTLALFDVPDVFGEADQPTLLLAASSPTPGWKSAAVEVTAGSRSFVARTAARKAVLGHALTLLGTGEPYLVDTSSSVDVELLDPDQWLLNCDDEALVGGTNLAVLGSELLQFGEAEPIGPGRFRLRRLLRGRAGTEWATITHAAGEAFSLIERDAVRTIALPDWILGSQIAATVISTAASPAHAQTLATGESRRPPAPTGIAAGLDAAGALAARWTRRSRRGWAWVDEIDAPLGESREQYRVTVTGPLGSIELLSDAPEATIPAADLARVGSGPATVEVRQIGDGAASRPAQCNVVIP
jgi:hypothetical protein